MTTNNHDRKKGRSANSGFAKKRVQWLIEHSTSHQILWYVVSFVLRNPLLRKAANRLAHYVSSVKNTDIRIKRALELAYKMKTETLYIQKAKKNQN